LGACAIVVLTLLAYYPALDGGFIWDDHSHVENNPVLFGPGGLKRIWFSLEAPQYYPLVFTSFRLERALWGVKPVGYHCVNLLLHAANALLVWQLLRRLKVPGAWLAAALFALHPVNVESVAWITERKNTLSMLFYLLSLLWFVRSDETPDRGQELDVRDPRPVSPTARRQSPVANHQPPDSQPSTLNLQRRWYGLSLLAFLLALLSKTAVAPLGLVLLGLAWWRRGLIGRRDLFRSAPFFALALLLIPITILAEHHAGSEIVRADSFCARLAGAGWAFWFYLYKVIWPLNLMFVYPRWQIDPANPLSYVPGLLVVGTFLLCWRFRRDWGKGWLAGLGYFGVMLLPVLGLVNIYFMRYSLVSDHWQYLAIIGPLALAAAGISRALERFQQTVRWIKPVACGSLLLALGVLTFRQSFAYKDDETLWRDTLAKNPAGWIAHNNLGVLLVAKGQTVEAIRQYQEAIRLKPDYADAQINLGVALSTKGQNDEALHQFQEAVRLSPDYASAHYNLGIALDEKGQIDEAISQYQEAIRLDPEHVLAHNNLGIAFGRKDQIDEAASQFQEAVRLSPDYAKAHYNFGMALGRKGQFDEAIRQFQEALRLAPDYAKAHYNLGIALHEKGHTEEAIRQYQEALRLKPDYADARKHLDAALAAKADALKPPGAANKP
jgi:tetratricopeptide (TPR) repeat protein